jgi:hypothetical protein
MPNAAKYLLNPQRHTERSEVSAKTFTSCPTQRSICSILNVILSEAKYLPKPSHHAQRSEVSAQSFTSCPTQRSICSIPNVILSEAKYLPNPSRNAQQSELSAKIKKRAITDSLSVVWGEKLPNRLA